jgi:hypothetical protein
MALVSKSKAAKLAGVSRTTIHRYATNGKLSMTGDKIETSELIRVFGSITEPSDTPAQSNDTGHGVTQVERVLLQDRIQQLESHVGDLKQDRDNWRSKADETADMLKVEQEKSLRLIENQQPVANNSTNLLPTVLSIAVVVVVVGYLALQYGSFGSTTEKTPEVKEEPVATYDWNDGDLRVLSDAEILERSENKIIKTGLVKTILGNYVAPSEVSRTDVSENERLRAIEVIETELKAKGVKLPKFDGVPVNQNTAEEKLIAARAYLLLLDTPPGGETENEEAEPVLNVNDPTLENEPETEP